MNPIKCIIQARLASTRLPGKILKEFYGNESILSLLINKLQKLNCELIVATSNNTENDPIQKLCEHKNVSCFRGDENNVLQRFIDAASHFNCERIIRICSDNPFLELQSLETLIKVAQNNPTCEYIGFKVGDIPSIQTHYGFWGEYTTIKCLKKVATLTSKPLYTEHVTNYIYTHTEKFEIKWIETPKILLQKPHIRLTIDTKQDFNTAQQIYVELTKVTKHPTIEQVIKYLDQNNPNHYKEMREQINKNSK